MPMEGNGLLAAASLCCITGVSLLRLAWARRQRSLALNGAAWGLLVLAMVLAWRSDGMWGVSIASLFGMGAACILLAWAGITSPPGKAAASTRRVRMLPETGEPKRIGRRIATFAMSVPLALIVSIGLGIALRGLAALAGWSEANANALGLFIVPLAWSIIACLMLMQEKRRGQWAILLACVLPSLPVIVTGVFA